MLCILNKLKRRYSMYSRGEEELRHRGCLYLFSIEAKCEGHGK